MARNWFIPAVFAGVFVLGGVTGGFLALRVTHGMIAEHGGPEQYAPRQMRRMTKMLELTEDQIRKIEPILERTSKLVNQKRRETVTILQATEKELGVVLTPEQRATWDTYRAESRARWEKAAEDRKRERDERQKTEGDGDGPRPHGPPAGD